MTDSSLDLDTDAIDAPQAAEFLRQIELRHAAMYQAAIGMDQRAAVLAAAFLAAAGAIAAGLISASGPPGWIITAATGSAGLLTAAGACCVFACRPQPYIMPGIMPEEWGQTAFLSAPVAHLHLSRADTLQMAMAQNEARQARNGRAMLAGFTLAAAAPAWAAIAFAMLRAAVSAPA